MPIRPATPPPPARAVVCYDGACALCRGSARRLRPWLARHGLVAAPLQAPALARRLGLAPGEVPERMLVLGAGGVVLGGSDAVLAILERGGAAPLVRLARRVPGFERLFERAYAFVAARRRRVALTLGWRPPPRRRPRLAGIAEQAFRGLRARRRAGW